jgi:hypothetical protein
MHFSSKNKISGALWANELAVRASAVKRGEKGTAFGTTTTVNPCHANVDHMVSS